MNVSGPLPVDHGLHRKGGELSVSLDRSKPEVKKKKTEDSLSDHLQQQLKTITKSTSAD